MHDDRPSCCNDRRVHGARTPAPLAHETRAPRAHQHPFPELSEPTKCAAGVWEWMVAGNPGQTHRCQFPYFRIRLTRAGDESARKHGVADADMLAAVSDVRLAIALDDDSPQRQLVLGFDTSTRLLEVVVLVFEDGREPLIIHAMPARRQYRDLLGERS